MDIHKRVSAHKHTYIYTPTHVAFIQINACTMHIYSHQSGIRTDAFTCSLAHSQSILVQRNAFAIILRISLQPIKMCSMYS